MYCYFSSEHPLAVKINGAFFGRIDGDAKGIRIDEESVFIEVCPLTFGETFGFVLDKNFLFNPPKHISVADLKGGFFIRISLPENFNGFNLVAQEKYPDAIVTVFSENGLKTSIETPQSFFSDNFLFTTDTAEISRINISDKDVIAIFFNKKSAVYLYELTDKIKKLGVILADSFFFNNGFLYTALTKKDIAKHKIESAYIISDGKIYEKERKISPSSEFDKTAISERLIPFAFFEELSLGGDYGFYLSDGVNKNADKLKSYFGDFLSVMPPPPFRNVNEIGLIYKTGENKYTVDYATVEIENGKIVNLKRSDV